MDIVHEVLFAQIQDAPDHIGQAIIDAVQRRDKIVLNHLFFKAYPTALWGKYFKALSEEDQKWVDENLSEPEQEYRLEEDYD